MPFIWMDENINQPEHSMLFSGNKFITFRTKKQQAISIRQLPLRSPDLQSGEAIWARG